MICVNSVYKYIYANNEERIRIVHIDDNHVYFVKIDENYQCQRYMI